VRNKRSWADPGSRLDSSWSFSCRRRAVLAQLPAAVTAALYTHRQIIIAPSSNHLSKRSWHSINDIGHIIMRRQCRASSIRGYTVDAATALLIAKVHQTAQARHTLPVALHLSARATQTDSKHTVAVRYHRFLPRSEIYTVLIQTKVGLPQGGLEKVKG
jgi:hypothetical protein